MSKKEILKKEILARQTELDAIEKAEHKLQQEEYDKHFHESDEFLNDVPLMIDISVDSPFISVYPALVGSNDVNVHVEFETPLCLSNKGSSTEWVFTKTYFMEMFNSFHEHHREKYMNDHQSKKDDCG